MESAARCMQVALTHLRNADPVLAGIIGRVGEYRIEYRDPDFDTLTRSIVYQQLSGRVARVIFERLRTAASDGSRLGADHVLKLRPARMRKAGLSGPKTQYIRDLARRTRSGELAFENLADKSDDEIIERLTAVRGVGVWTAQMFLIFALRRPDVLPVADLGIRSAMQRAYQLDALPKPPQMEDLARTWRPWRSVACWYLWRSLDNQAAL